jgi:hypothetical protein
VQEIQVDENSASGLDDWDAGTPKDHSRPHRIASPSARTAPTRGGKRLGEAEADGERTSLLPDAIAPAPERRPVRRRFWSLRQSSAVARRPS